MFGFLNVELTNRCNKACHFCGRAKDRENMTLGEMDMELFATIIRQFDGESIQFNKDGDPLLYGDLGEVGRKCKSFVTNIVTNGILLYDRHEDLKDFDTVTISVIEDDIHQFNAVEKFIRFHDRPRVLIKFLGDYHNPEYEKLGLKTMRRSIHDPDTDTGYSNGKPVIPELGVCLDFLNKPSVNWEGEMFICNRYDPEKLGKIGDCKDETIRNIWNGNTRNLWLKHHRGGHRFRVPLCKTCEFWGVPTG